MPLSNASGKHIVTIEGINRADGGLTPIQNAMVTNNGSQCGFCTPGFVMSMTCMAAETNHHATKQAVQAIDGNICRCTGYKSIERAALSWIEKHTPDGKTNALQHAINTGVLPPWFAEIETRLHSLHVAPPNSDVFTHPQMTVGGGTDLYVQRPEALAQTTAPSFFDHPALHGIYEHEDTIEVGASTTVTDFLESPVLQKYFPDLDTQLRLVSSTPIRNMATIGGNLINASPIGDMTIWLLALDATIVLRHTEQRAMPLRDFYQGYKKLDKSPEEWIEKIIFRKPGIHTFFSFEKISKRKYLDIASVNSAMTISLLEDHIAAAHISMGGVAPIPLYLKNTASSLIHMRWPIDPYHLEELHHMLQYEIHPIDDVRGSAVYKRLLARQFLQAHLFQIEDMYAKR